MKAYSHDLRERIVRAVEDGLPKAEAARTYQVGLSTVKRYVVQWRREHHLRHKVSSGRPAHIAPAHYPALEAQVRARPDATLAEHCAAWEASHGVRLSVSAMQRTLVRLDWPLKKSP
jgi:transposase